MKKVSLDTQARERFWAKVNKNGPIPPLRPDLGPCWIWTAAIVREYGMFKLHGKMVKAHRVSYVLNVRDIGDTEKIDHQCHVECCVNPSHLTPATVKQNAENRAGANRGSSSGVRGVHAAGNKWRVVVGHNGKHIRCGLYGTIAEAEAVAIAKRRELFTNNLLDRKA